LSSIKSFITCFKNENIRLAVGTINENIFNAGVSLRVYLPEPALSQYLTSHTNKIACQILPAGKMQTVEATFRHPRAGIKTCKAGLIELLAD
jgi:hypothetical protein